MPCIFSLNCALQFELLLPELFPEIKTGEKGILSGILLHLVASKKSTVLRGTFVKTCSHGCFQSLTVENKCVIDREIFVFLMNHRFYLQLCPAGGCQ